MLQENGSPVPDFLHFRPFPIYSRCHRFFWSGFLCKAAQNGESISRRIGRQEIGNGVLLAARTRKKDDWPFRDSPFLYMSVLAWGWFEDALLLQD